MTIIIIFINHLHTAVPRDEKFFSNQFKIDLTWFNKGDVCLRLTNLLESDDDDDDGTFSQTLFKTP